MDNNQLSRAALTVDEFCVAHGIGRTLFYELQKDSRGPRVMRVGRRTLITAEAAAEWRARMERDTAEAAA